MLTDSSEYQQLLTPFFSPISHELSQWMHEKYDKNIAHPENLIYSTASGNVVRSKIQKYASCGIVPGIHLITTYETKEHPLSTEIIEKIIKHYFL